MKTQGKTLDIIMNSSLDPNAGGRETWLYNFLPLLIDKKEINNIRLYGCRTQNQKDHSDAINALVENKDFLLKIFKVKRLKLPIAYSFFKALKKEPIKDSPDCVLAVGIFELIIILYLKRYKTVKKIVWLRSIFSHEKSYAIPNFLKKIVLKNEISFLKKADLILANGDDIQSFYEDLGLEIKVIKNGVSLKKWNVPPVSLDSPIHIAYIGRLSKVKGIEDYLKLVHQIKSSPKSSTFIFHIVGNNGSYKEQVNDLANCNYVVNHNIMNNEQLPQFLSGIDVCVALTYASANGGGGGTSNAMMEQMAAERIILAWNNVIFQQYLNEENAYLCEQKSVNSLEKRLLEIDDNRNKARIKALNAKETILPYSYDLNVSKFIFEIENL